MFTHFRYIEKWITPQGLRKWKLTEMYHEMLEMAPDSLSILIELFLYLEDLPDRHIPDYTDMVKKLRYAKDALLDKEETDPLKEDSK